MYEKIEVFYKPAVVDGAPLYHKYLIYTDKDGKNSMLEAARATLAPAKRTERKIQYPTGAL